MSTTSLQATARIRGLRANALAGLIMLLIEYSLGISVNLYSTLPAADKGKTLFAGLGAAVGNGPLLVTLHALLGTLLLITGTAALVRALRLGARPLIALSGTAFLATLVAWLAGSAFVGHHEDAASLAMALAAAASILCYTLVIFTLSLGRTTSPARQEQVEPMEVPHRWLHRHLARDRRSLAMRGNGASPSRPLSSS
jgi:hypothetical protein